MPLFVPHTPGGELAKRMREAEAKNHQGRKIRFKIVEKGGITLENLLRRSNPWSAESCGRPESFPCQGGRGGMCWREGAPTPSPAKSVEKRSQHILENLDEMLIQEEKSISKRKSQKMKTTLSFGCIRFITIKVERM